MFHFFGYASPHSVTKVHFFGYASPHSATNVHFFGHKNPYFKANTEFLVQKSAKKYFPLNPVRGKFPYKYKILWEKISNFTDFIMS